MKRAPVLAGDCTPSPKPKAEEDERTNYDPTDNIREGMKRVRADD